MEIIDWKLILNAVLFSVVGIVIFLAFGWIYDKLTPFNLWKELIDNKNTAVAIVFGSMMIGLSIIIAFAHG